MAETKIPYCFVWTPNYEIFAQILKKGIAEYPFLEDKSIFIPQEIWDTNSQKALGHPMTGCSLKIQMVCKLLLELPENSYFIFSDADILLFPEMPFFELIDLYRKLDADIVFMREHNGVQFSNVGFSLIRVNDINRNLFQEALRMFHQEPAGLDGNFINECLKTYKGSHFWFPCELIANTCSLSQQDEIESRISIMRSKLMIYQALSDAYTPVESQIIQKLTQYKILGIPIEFK